MAVLPTPGSPIKMALGFCFLNNASINRFNSFSLSIKIGGFFNAFAFKLIKSGSPSSSLCWLAFLILLPLF
mgnify:CR=1 FL=1